MKAYLLTSGTLFALLAAVHLFIVVEHWRAGPGDPWYVIAPAVLLVISASLTAWAWRLWKGSAA